MPLKNRAAFEGRRYLVKLDFLFNMMSVAGLSDIQNAGLIEINRCLGRALKEESDQNVNDFVQKIFRLLKRTVSQNQYRSSIIDCITTLAKEVFEFNNHSSRGYLHRGTRCLRFSASRRSGIDHRMADPGEPDPYQEHPLPGWRLSPETAMDKETSLGAHHQS